MKNILLVFFPVLFSTGLYAGGDPPVAGYSYYIEFVGAGSEVYFLNESTEGETYYWDFGDGATSTDLHPVHAYPEPGIFIVCLTTTNEFGSDTFCDTLNTYYAPFADFAFSGDPEVTFTDLSTNYPESWDWFFGDDSTSSLQNPVHTYAANGEYNVCLSVGNPGGTSYVCKTVIISSYIITEAAFTYSGDPDVSFTDLSTNSPTEWFWDFGDGTTSTGQNPDHLYSENGSFEVCLTATNGGGSDTYCEVVNIVDAVPEPVAHFDYVLIGLEVAFIDLSENEPVEWYWDFGDGAFSEEQNPVHEYATDGTYPVCLTATNEGGSNTQCEDLFVAAAVDQNELSMFVSPNPATDFIVLNIAGIHIENIRTISLTGAEIELDFVENSAGISTLPRGIYITTAQTDEGIYRFRWMKQ